MNKINIVIEGMDAVGKRTVAEALTERLNRKPVKMELTKDRERDKENDWYWEQQENEYNLLSFPEYDCTSGALLTEYLQTRSHIPADIESIKRDSLLYSLNRFETISSSYPMSFLEKEPKGFVFDRYTTSNILYQTMHMKPEEKLAYIKWLKDIEYNLYNLPKPDKVIVLISTSDKLIQNNIEERGRETDFLETVEHQTKVRNNILFMVEHENWIPVIVNNGDVMRPREVILEEVYNKIIGG